MDSGFSEIIPAVPHRAGILAPEQTLEPPATGQRSKLVAGIAHSPTASWC
jgi:hypothetical protein